MLDTWEVITKDLQDCSLYWGCLFGQYTKLVGLRVNTDDDIAILSGGAQDIERYSPSQEILVLSKDGRHL